MITGDAGQRRNDRAADDRYADDARTLRGPFTQSSQASEKIVGT